MTHAGTTTAAATTAIGGQGLSEQARAALTAELFARWHAGEPDKHLCFCGSEGDLVAAVQRLRHVQDRHTDDRDLPDRERG